MSVNGYNHTMQFDQQKQVRPKTYGNKKVNKPESVNIFAFGNKFVNMSRSYQKEQISYSTGHTKYIYTWW